MSHRSTRVRRLGAVIVAAVAAASLAACGAGTADSAGGTAPAASSKNPAIAAAVATIHRAEQPITSWPGITPIKHPVSLAGKKVMIVPLSVAVPILNGMAVGAQQALQHLGAQVTVCDGKASPTTVATCLQQAQAEHVYAVITNFVAYPMDPNGIDALADSGTKVLIAGDTPVRGTTYPANVRFADSSASLMKLSADEADAAIADKGTSANVLSLGLSDTGSQREQSAEVQSEFQRLCPSCGFAEADFTTPNADKLASTVSAQLVSHPNTNVVILPVDTFVQEAIQGIQSAGFLNKVEVIATGSDLAGLQRIQSGQQSHDFGAPAIYDGYALVNALEQQLAGENPTPAQNVTRDFTKADIGGLNVSTSEYLTSDWFGNDSFEKGFYRAWGAK